MSDFFNIFIYNTMSAYIPMVIFYYFLFVLSNRKFRLVKDGAISLIVSLLICSFSSFISTVGLDPETGVVNDFILYINLFLSVLIICIAYAITTKTYTRIMLYYFVILFFLASASEFVKLFILVSFLGGINMIELCFFFNLFDLLFLFSIIFIVKKTSFVDMLNFTITENKKIIYSIFFVLISLLLQYLLLYNRDNIQNTYPMMIFLLLLIFVAMIFGSAFYKRSQEAIRMKEASLLQQNDYLNTLENIQKEISIFQHDYKNALSAIYLQVNEGNIEYIQQYLEDVIAKFDNTLANKIKQTTNLSNIELIELKSLILTKIIKLEQDNKKYQLEVINKVNKVNMNINDFIVSIGILIDNGIEAIKEQDTLSISLISEEDQLVVIIKNNLYESINLTKIYLGGISSKKDNSGLGLYSYKRIIDNYSNCFIETKVENNKFIQILTIKH